jgi:hypothetical protein
VTALVKLAPLALVALLVVGPAVCVLLTYLLNRSIPRWQREDCCFAESSDGHLESELEARFRRFARTVDLEAFCRSGPERAVPPGLVVWAARADRRDG